MVSYQLMLSLKLMFTWASYYEYISVCAQHMMHIGNHTFAALRGKESYELISSAFHDLIQEINDVIDKGEIHIGEAKYQLQFLLGGDYKVD